MHFDIRVQDIDFDEGFTKFSYSYPDKEDVLVSPFTKHYQGEYVKIFEHF